jgi:hypothetical protein
MGSCSTREILFFRESRTEFFSIEFVGFPSLSFSRPRILVPVFHSQGKALVRLLISLCPPFKSCGEHRQAANIVLDSIADSGGRPP